MWGSKTGHSQLTCEHGVGTNQGAGSAGATRTSAWSPARSLVVVNKARDRAELAETGIHVGPVRLGPLSINLLFIDVSADYRRVDWLDKAEPRPEAAVCRWLLLWL
jgi:hypothetical protein